MLAARLKMLRTAGGIEGLQTAQHHQNQQHTAPKQSHIPPPRIAAEEHGAIIVPLTEIHCKPPPENCKVSDTTGERD